ncbi:Alpha/Beta hydrolase protein [Aspergillus tetrazonus]
MLAPIGAVWATSPTVTLSPSATVIGSSTSGLDIFRGIPFAQPPVESLRFRPPRPMETPLGSFDATSQPRACPQFLAQADLSQVPTGVLGELLNTPLFQSITNAGEDCLTLDVIRPSNVSASDKLPVIVWIYGGAYASGSTQSYNLSGLASDSINLSRPVIFVAANYRVGGFGFLAGKELLRDGSTNLGLLDQRLSLEWVADNIEAFGGDPTKVTLFGESAGSISVFTQLALYGGDNTYKGKPLFRAAIMDSGCVQPALAADSETAQEIYDNAVRHAGCSSAEDTLECLRQVDYTTLLNALNSVPGLLSYQSIVLRYLPRPDGKVLPDAMETLAQQGRFAKVPFIIGDQEDEGTFFALQTSNVTTPADAYPEDPAAGSPYGTGLKNNWYPQFKRMASIMGDTAFLMTRRAFLDASKSTHPDVPFWSFLSSYFHDIPILGTFHGSDLLLLMNGIGPSAAADAIKSYYFSFVYELDPNVGSGLISWPQWTENKELLHFTQEGATGLITDTFRQEAYEIISTQLSSLSL